MTASQPGRDGDICARCKRLPCWCTTRATYRPAAPSEPPVPGAIRCWDDEPGCDCGGRHPEPAAEAQQDDSWLVELADHLERPVTAVGRPDNGQDECGAGLKLDPAIRCVRPSGHEPYHRGAHGPQWSDRWATPASARAGAGEQQREQVVLLLEMHGRKKAALCSCGWRDLTVPLSVSWERHVADELLALLAHTDEETR